MMQSQSNLSFKSSPTDELTNGPNSITDIPSNNSIDLDPQIIDPITVPTPVTDETFSSKQKNDILLEPKQKKEVKIQENPKLEKKGKSLFGKWTFKKMFNKK
jgi:hypothetical protein